MLSDLLHRTAMFGQTEILNLLIGHGVDINTRTNNLVSILFSQMYLLLYICNMQIKFCLYII